MKTITLILITTVCCTNAIAQTMEVKKFNFTSFSSDHKAFSELLEKKSSSEAKEHPEYAILPFNAQCTECVELIDRRTIDSRFFIDPKNAGHTYSQQSYFPLHYKRTENDIWRTIDPHLKQTSSGVYEALNQPVPTKCNLNTKSTSITEKGVELEFNKELTLFFFDENILYTQPEKGNYTDYTIGEEGLEVKNIWSGINMEQIFTAGQVKTNYIITAPLTLPVTQGWMVIEDHFTLPAGITIEETADGVHLPGGYYRGDYLFKNANGETLFMYEKPVYLDTRVMGMPGTYNLVVNGSNCTLQTLIPIEWLTRADNVYPLVIDPVVVGITKIGDFAGLGLSANMAFTTMSLGSCDYHMVVNVPGKSTLMNVYADLEYNLTYDNMCGNPPLPIPFCTFSQVQQEIKCDSCNTTSGLLGCNPAVPPYTGYCTTDSNKVLGAQAVMIDSANSFFLSCYQPQCSDYPIAFTLSNRDSICGDVCGYLCARGNIWQMTVEASQVEATITATDTILCGGDSIIISTQGEGGITPYTYLYTTDGGNSFDTVSNSPFYTISPVGNVTVTCYIIDSCNGYYITNHLNLIVNPNPVISFSDDTLTASCATCIYQWYRNDTLLPGDTLSYYVPDVPGYYKVFASDTTGCAGFSSVYAHLVSSSASLAYGNSEITIVPNPSKGNFAIRFSDMPESKMFSMLMYDVSGRLIEAKNNLTILNGSYVYNPAKKLPAGTYLLEIILDKERLRERVIIME